jgi:hypothetical protein
MKEGKEGMKRRKIGIVGEQLIYKFLLVVKRREETK